MSLDFYISKYSVAVPLLAFVLGMVKSTNQSSGFYRIGALVGFYTFFELLTTYSGLFGFSQNLILLLPYIVLEYLLLLWCLQGQRNNALNWLLICTLVLEKWLIGNDWLSISRTIEGFLILYLVSQWFKGTYRSPERKIERLPKFYLCCALILYFLPTLPIFLNDAKVFQIDTKALLVLYGVKNVLNAISKILIAVELWRD